MESAEKELKFSQKKKPRSGSNRTVDEKLEIIKRLNDGETLLEVCAKEKIREITVLKWLEEKSKIENLFKAKQQNRLNLLRIHNAHKTMRLINQQIQDALYSWYMSCLKNGVKIRNRQIAEKAVKFNKTFGGKRDFTASTSYVASWKKKYKIDTNFNHLQKTGQSVMEYFRERLIEIIEDDALTSDQVFICGELKINYKTIPTRESIIQQFKGKALNKKNCSKGFNKVACEELSIMFCSNTTGTLKLPLMVIGNSMIKIKKELPLYYKCRDRELMGGHAFEEWQREKGIPRVRRFLKRKNLSPMALLIVSHFYTSGEVVGFNEKIAYLPPNASDLTASFNQKVLKELKLRFWLKMFSSFIDNEEKNETHMTDMKIEEVLDLLNDAWNETSVKAYFHLWNFLRGNENIQMQMGEDINLFSELLSLIERFHGEKGHEYEIKEVETIQIDSDEESEMRDEVEDIVVVYLDSEGSETNLEREESKTDSEISEINFEEQDVQSSFEVEEVKSKIEEEEEEEEEEMKLNIEEDIKILIQDNEYKSTETNHDTPGVACAEIDETYSDQNSLEASNTTVEGCITSLEMAIQFFQSRNKYEEFSEDIQYLRNLINKACDLEIEMDTD